MMDEREKTHFLFKVLGWDILEIHQLLMQLGGLYNMSIIIFAEGALNNEKAVLV